MNFFVPLVLTKGNKLHYISQLQLQVQFSGSAFVAPARQHSHHHPNKQTNLNCTMDVIYKHIQQLNTKGPEIHFKFLQALQEAKGPTRPVIVLRQQYMHLNVTAKWECPPTRHTVQKNSCIDDSNVGDAGTFRHTMVDAITFSRVYAKASYLQTSKTNEIISKIPSRQINIIVLSTCTSAYQPSD